MNKETSLKEHEQEQNNSEGSNGENYELLLNKQKKKTTIFLVLTIALTILFFGSLAWGISESNDNSGPKFRNERMGSGQFEQKMDSKDRAIGDMEKGQRMMMKMRFDKFLNSDGTVNTQEVTDFLSRMPENAKENLVNKLNDNLEQAVKDGKITQEQANALKNAIIK